VIQGERDGFGAPDDVRRLRLPDVTVHAVAGGDHTLKTRALDGRTTADAVAEAVRVATAWIAAIVTRAGQAAT
jgi:predicted alpha/beta-hydrolase family hydrolase